jgi:hypothetical protein
MIRHQVPFLDPADGIEVARVEAVDVSGQQRALRATHDRGRDIFGLLSQLA